jgi:Fe-S-cluster-containing dehydrogenase component
MSVTRRTVLKGLAVAGAAAASAKVEARDRKIPAGEAVGMLYDGTRCIGCRACVTRCKEANDLPVDRSADRLYDAAPDLSGTTKNVIRLAEVADGRYAFVKAQCMHCVDPACTSVCMIGALRKNAATGVVEYEKDGCVGCRYCQVACPFNVPKFTWGKAVPQIVKCELCRHRADPARPGPFAVANPACCEACPREAVIYGKRSDLLAEAKRRIARSPGTYEPKIYGESDAGGTQVLYLAGRGVSFARLGLPDVGPDPVPELSESVQHGIYYGMIAPVVLLGAALVSVRRNANRHGEDA